MACFVNTVVECCHYLLNRLNETGEFSLIIALFEVATHNKIQKQIEILVHVISVLYLVYVHGFQ